MRLLLFFIKLPLPAVHIPCRDNSQEFTTPGKYYNEQASSIGSSKCCISSFGDRMLWISKNNQMFIKKYLLTLPVLNVMPGGSGFIVYLRLKTWIAGFTGMTSWCNLCSSLANTALSS
jgi:hypothetical protein